MISAAGVLCCLHVTAGTGSSEAVIDLTPYMQQTARITDSTSEQKEQSADALLDAFAERGYAHVIGPRFQPQRTSEALNLARYMNF